MMSNPEVFPLNPISLAAFKLMEVCHDPIRFTEFLSSLSLYEYPVTDKNPYKIFEPLDPSASSNMKNGVNVAPSNGENGVNIRIRNNKNDIIIISDPNIEKTSILNIFFDPKYDVKVYESQRNALLNWAAREIDLLINHLKLDNLDNRKLSQTTPTPTLANLLRSICTSVQYEYTKLAPAEQRGEKGKWIFLTMLRSIALLKVYDCGNTTGVKAQKSTPLYNAQEDLHEAIGKVEGARSWLQIMLGVIIMITGIYITLATFKVIATILIVNFLVAGLFLIGGYITLRCGMLQGVAKNAHDLYDKIKYGEVEHKSPSPSNMNPS